MSAVRSANGRIDLLVPAPLKLAPSLTRSLLPSQFYLLCRCSQKLHSTSRLNPSMSLASLRLHSPWRRSDVSQEETSKAVSQTVPWLEGQLEAAGANRAPAAPRLKSTE